MRHASSLQHNTDGPSDQQSLTQLRWVLPIGYVLEQGLVLQSEERRPICSPLRVVAQLRDPDGRGWSRHVQVIAPDKRMVDCVVPNAELEAKPSDAIARLADCGLQVFGRRDDIVSFIKAWAPKGYGTRLDRPGWSGDHTYFALATGEVIAPRKSAEAATYMGPINRHTSGDLAGWREGIAKLAVGNPYLMFAISLAFSGPLLSLVGTTGGIFHLHGATSIGKTKLLQASMSVWPSPEKEFAWRSTSAGLEGLLFEASDTFLGLDELPLDPHSGFADDIYLAANGSGKNRSTVTGRAQASNQWRVPVLSTGEIPGQKALSDIGRSMRGGQAVRLIDIPVVDMAYGVFHWLHGHSSAAKFVREVERLVARDVGYAGPAFVKNLICFAQERNLENMIEKRWGMQLEILLRQLNLDCEKVSSEIRRVLDRFALVSVAGEIASEMKITGWKANLASESVSEIAKKWFEHRGGSGRLEETIAVHITRDYLLKCGDSHFSRLQSCGDGGGEGAASIARSFEMDGYHDLEYFYIFSSAIGRIHKGYDTKQVISNLFNSGYLVKNGKQGYQTRMSSKIPGRPNVYRISKDILGA